MYGTPFLEAPIISSEGLGVQPGGQGLESELRRTSTAAGMGSGDRR